MTLSEKQIQTAVIQNWRTRGYEGTLVAAIPNAKAFGQPGLTPGLFDLLCVGERIGCAFLELKTEGGKLSHHQQAFKEMLMRNRVRFGVAYGLDEALEILETWGLLRRAK